MQSASIDSFSKWQFELCYLFDEVGLSRLLYTYYGTYFLQFIVIFVFSASNLMCACPMDHPIQIVDPLAEQEISSFDATLASAMINTFTASSDGSIVFVVRRSGTLVIYRDQRLLRTITKHKFHELAISESGDAFVGLAHSLA